MAWVKTATLVLYGCAFLLQALGAIGVIRDVRTSIRNMRQLKADLIDAEATADEHRRKIEVGRQRQRNYVLQQAYGRLADALGEAAVDQTGPAAAQQRRALVKYVTAQNDISDRRRWAAVYLLLGGLVLGFVGNVVSLFPL
ncbi:hypothetical protein MAV101_11330 [Mycobacterium avium subsp. hominissuis 101]|uniref:Uncharacterized protein n=1 Tax=Mycobacterium avium (strain 104) TaxID=243243 RepID=A0A0H2ZV89_MYCA1|nr:hypothetical protein MAV_2250 [Mycobacterium avium 104]EUA39771.1 hypothetical protein I549_4111 [Mycobacterium avium subsp. avium 2285 (R)]KDP06422.1 hypothetical protein MAV101_11330 [Mycobacterium avium subsp. hominissuis 101]